MELNNKEEIYIDHLLGGTMAKETPAPVVVTEPIINEATESQPSKDMYAALVKFKDVLKNVFPSTHAAHGKVWTTFNDLYETIKKEL